jgi:hypothetical protein
MCPPQPSPPPIDLSGLFVGGVTLASLSGLDAVVTGGWAFSNIWRAPLECGK